VSELSPPDQALIKDGIEVTNVAEGITKINGLNFAKDTTEQKAAPAASSTPSATPTKTKPQ
jgi:protein phosphatase